MRFFKVALMTSLVFCQLFKFGKQLWMRCKREEEEEEEKVGLSTRLKNTERCVLLRAKSM